MAADIIQVLQYLDLSEFHPERKNGDREENKLGDGIYEQLVS